MIVPILPRPARPVVLRRAVLCLVAAGALAVPLVLGAATVTHGREGRESLPAGAAGRVSPRTVPAMAVVRVSRTSAVMNVTHITGRVAVDQDFLVAVYDNGSTGYTWKAQAVKGLQVWYDEFPPNKKGPRGVPLVGAPSIRVYHIMPLKPSSKPYVERLLHLRVFERTPPIAEVIVTLTIQPQA